MASLNMPWNIYATRSIASLNIPWNEYATTTRSVASSNIPWNIYAMRSVASLNMPQDPWHLWICHETYMPWDLWHPWICHEIHVVTVLWQCCDIVGTVLWQCCDSALWVFTPLFGSKRWLFSNEVRSLFSNLRPLAYQKIGKPTPSEVSELMLWMCKEAQKIYSDGRNELLVDCTSILNTLTFLCYFSENMKMYFISVVVSPPKLPHSAVLQSKYFYEVWSSGAEAE